jgi:peptidoglycan L-alanyl-D-glutamate endopeptidase CwlK
MPVNRKLIFDASKRLGAIYKTAADVKVMDDAIDAAYAEPVLVTPAPAPQPAPQPMSQFTLSALSLDRLKGVRPELVACVKLAIRYSLIDFRVQQGQRTLAEQTAAVKAGNSRTMHSKHLVQPDGLVWAVDLVVLDSAGVVDWTFNKYAAIAFAMDKAATELGFASHIRWGCAWDRVLSDFGGQPQAYLDEASAYAKRHAGSDLLDAPHFEWVP